MKNVFYLLMGIILFSCKKDNTPYGSEFDQSKQKWNTYKTSINNSYSYIAYSNSVFGFYNQTTIFVENGKVTTRIYVQGMYPQGPGAALQITDSWVENETTLNTHTGGAAAITLDDIYAEAPAKWLRVDTNKNDVYFDTDANGLIASCGYYPKGCQDDCFTGIFIKSITPL
jgi:hypothetical protein